VTLTYSRRSPLDAVADVEEHVRAHLSAVASPDDDGTVHAAEVRIRHEDPGDDGVLVVGELDAEANAPYLRPGFTPEQDIAANPLTVESIEERS
jgi:hypothetical protein